MHKAALCSAAAVPGMSRYWNIAAQLPAMQAAVRTALYSMQEHPRMAPLCTGLSCMEAAASSQRIQPGRRDLSA